MASKRRDRIVKARAQRKAQKAAGMRAPGDKTRYALKKAGRIMPEYRLEGGYLLDPAYMRVLGMPGPFVVTLVEAQ